MAPVIEFDPWLQAQVATALEQLPVAQRDVIALHYMGGLSFPEVAQTLGIGADAARARATRAYQQLRELLVDCVEVPQ